MVQEVEQALRLQEFDKRISELTNEIAALPKHVAAIEKQLEAHLRKLETNRAALAANQRERKQRELDIQTQEQKISKLNDQTLQAKTNEQYRAFQHEIEYCRAEIRKAEDRILDLMTESEPLEAEVKSAEAELAVEKKQVEAEKASARERTETDKREMADVQEKRRAGYSALSPAMQRHYDRLKKKHANGVVVSDVRNGLCSACRLTLRPQFYQELRSATTVMFCENCGRMLRYAPAVDVQAEFEGGTRVALS